MLGSAAHSVLNNLKKKKLPPLSKNEFLTAVENQIESGNLPVSKKACPECGRFFSVIRVHALSLDACVYCKSLWFDAGELSEVTQNTRDVPSDDLVHRKSRYSCPVCKKTMRECVYKSPANLLVDKCPEDHGVYLESGELKRAFES